MWTSLAATVLLVGGAIGSRGRWSGWDDQRGWHLGLNNGGLCFVWHSPYIRQWIAANRTRTGWGTEDTIGPPLWWWFDDYSVLGGGWQAGISLWLPAGAMFAVSTRSAFMVYRTHRHPGHCAKCRYDCSGLPTDALCPECGHARA